jgi:pimeloyl-ACP methyl ester carboxylesterase
VTLAQGLGERVIVAGFSIGGLLATWIAERYPVERVVAIAPFFGISWVPSSWMGALSRMFLALPNRFEWWDPIAREKQMPAHGYPRYSTHALAQAYMLAHEVIQRAPQGVAAKRLTFVTNARETAVSNRTVRRLETALGAKDPTRLEHVVLTGIPFSHDIIEPLRHPEIANAVYPQLLGLISDPLGL